MSEVQVPDLAPCQGLEGPVPRRDGVFEGVTVIVLVLLVHLFFLGMLLY